MSQVVSGRGGVLRSRRGRLAILIVLVVVFALACAVLARLVLPPLLANLSARVETTDTTVEIGGASLTVPAEWSVRRSFVDPDSLLVTSPDGNLDVTFSPSPRSPRAAFSDAAPSVGDPIEEPLGSGLTSVHAQTAPETVTAAVGEPDGAVIVVATAEGDLPRYTCVLAHLIESVRVRTDSTAVAR
ncbi:hypothetical protein [Microbacterium sp. SORGH_AS_0888]|uniref:hypothetical protein n=1 Tax=Microbacterium sp. SORGH_AS_0888 TaxID=3041791 RepID=UPI00278990D2|nr:hypothetical protein [Microbacterium sp. SORGH_AS_0888]MDQ1131254.1 hypothetical protein [Microbacterium sp. SORGH_AS_0888]